MYWFNKNFCLVFLNFVLLLFLLNGCGAGGGGGSNTNVQNNTDTTTPSVPTGLAAVAGDGQVTLSWNAVSNASSYNLYMASVSGVSKSNYNTLPDGMKHTGVTSPYVHSGLVNGKTYYFVITAVNSNGESSESAQVSNTPISQKGTLSGKLLVGPSLSQAPKVLPKSVDTESSEESQAEFVIGEVIVKFKETITITEGVARLKENFKNEDLQMTSEFSAINVAVLRTDIYHAYKNGSLSKEEALQRTVDIIQQIQSRSFIIYAEPNYIGSVQKIPNDPGYGDQWHYKAIALPAAWDITTGNNNVIVAVLDNGIRFNHPDLEDPKFQDNILDTGYDFVSDPQCGGDGHGIDSDPSASAGDIHGTHVAGTVAALSNNRIGVAGVAWNVKIMPVRVIGCNGSGLTAVDLSNGLYYASGLPNDSKTIPPQKAKIINMSLRLQGNSSLVQEAINQVVAQGVTVIAAAGNHALEGNPIIYPCANNNVICVGAVSPSLISGLKRAPYSNFNSYIDVVAPGGNMSLFESNGVKSTVWDDNYNQPEYKFSQGTSMAAPHVAGVAALMLSVNPSLLPAQIEQILKETAYDLGPSGRDDEYGYGLINAYHAVSYGSLLTKPVLQTQPGVLYFTSADLQGNVAILNIGGSSLTINSVANIEKSGGNWLSTSVDKNVAPAIITATVSPSGLSPGVYRATINITTTEGNEKIPVIFDNRTTPDLGTITVWLLDTSGNFVAQTTTSKTKGYTYEFTNLEPGQYYVIAGTDWNGNGVPGDNWGEFIGTFPMLGDYSIVKVEAGKTASGIDFSLHDIGDLVSLDGNGLEPISGALLVNVVDETGEPVEGATVYISDGSFSGTTNPFGRTTILGNFTGQQTVTATAPGYSTHTYYQTNASYLTFILSRIKPPTTTLAVTLTGLSSGEIGCIWINSDQECALYAGSNPILNFTVPQDTPVTLSAIAYYYSNEVPTKFFHYHYNDGFSAPASINSPLGPPLSWRYLQEWVNKPSGNFSKTSPIEWGAYSYAYLGLHQSPVWTGFRSNSYFTFSFLADSWFDIWMAKTDEPDYNALGVCAINGLDDDGRPTDSSELSCKYAQASFDQLPSAATYNLYDIPYLYMPVSITVSSLTPTFWWSNTFQPSLQGVTISEPVTGYEWEIDVPSGVSMITLPNIPTGGLSGGTAYEWKVMNMIAPSFDYNNFDMKYVMQNLWGLSQSQTGDFVTP